MGHELNKAESLYPSLSRSRSVTENRVSRIYNQDLCSLWCRFSWGQIKKRRGEEDQLALHRYWYCAATSWGKLSLSIKMRGGLRGAEGVQVSEGIIYERG